MGSRLFRVHAGTATACLLAIVIASTLAGCDEGGFGRRIRSAARDTFGERLVSVEAHETPEPYKSVQVQVALSSSTLEPLDAFVMLDAIVSITGSERAYLSTLLQQPDGTALVEGFLWTSGDSRVQHYAARFDTWQWPSAWDIAFDSYSDGVTAEVIGAVARGEAPLPESEPLR